VMHRLIVEDGFASARGQPGAQNLSRRRPYRILWFPGESVRGANPPEGMLLILIRRATSGCARLRNEAKTPRGPSRDDVPSIVPRGADKEDPRRGLRRPCGNVQARPPLAAFHGGVPSIASDPICLGNERAFDEVRCSYCRRRACRTKRGASPGTVPPQRTALR
jgi:hypothetical protein